MKTAENSRAAKLWNVATQPRFNLKFATFDLLSSPVHHRAYPDRKILHKLSGLWTADLSITQLFQETVPESQRGSVGGIQHSLNQLMDLLKSVLVMILPYAQTFGLLIIASVVAVSAGLVSLLYFCRRYANDSQAGTVSGKAEAEDELLT